MKKILAAALIAGSLFSVSVANAEIKTYEGSEEYLMSEFETIDIAKQRAKQKAERIAQEKAGVYISSYSEMKDFELVKDEVVSIACGIISIVDVKYDVTPADNANGFLIRATVKANIDTDDVNKWLDKSAQEKSSIVTQNKELQAAVAAQDETISKLKRQIEKLKGRENSAANASANKLLKRSPPRIRSSKPIKSSRRRRKVSSTANTKRRSNSATSQFNCIRLHEFIAGAARLTVR